MSINHETDYDALADRFASDDFEPSGSSWSVIHLAEVRAFALLRREYETAMSKYPEASADEPLLRFLRKGRDDAAERLAAARARALEAGVRPFHRLGGDAGVARLTSSRHPASRGGHVEVARHGGGDEGGLVVGEQVDGTGECC